MRRTRGRRYVGSAWLCALTFTLLAGGCYTDPAVTGSTYPFDYRERHPIRLTEGSHSVQLLIGSGNGALTAEQRAQVAFMASNWRRESTGRLVVDVPRGTPNARAANYALREIRSLLRAAGIPPRAIAVRHYQPPEAREFGPIRISYTRIEADAGPCGDWPEDLGAAVAPSLQPIPPTIDNRPYWNLGCATQHNLAAMVANPEDLVQPRAESGSYAARRQQVMDKYRKGEDPSTLFTKSTDAKVSNVGQ